MRTPKILLLFVPLVTGLAQSTDPSAPAYFTVYNVTGDSTVSQQFVVKITNALTIQQARTVLTEPESERPHVRGIVVKAPAYFNSPWSFHVDPATVGFFDASVEVCDASTSEVENHLMQVGEAFLPDSVWCPWSSSLLAEIPTPDAAATSLRIASAASDSEAAISPGALISIYGQNLTGLTESATTANPVATLAGITVQIKAASEATSRQLSLLLGSPSQVNALVPADMPLGPVTVSVISNGQTFQGASYVEPIAPALFSVDQNNRDYAAASLQRVHPDGTSSFESLVTVDPGSGRMVPVPLDFGSPNDELYLSLYGTGFVNSNASQVTLTLAAESTPILFAGPQAKGVGLDQVNIPISQSLSAQPFLDLQPIVTSPGGFPVKTNLVRILIQSSATNAVKSAAR